MDQESIGKLNRIEGWRDETRGEKKKTRQDETMEGGRRKAGLDRQDGLSRVFTVPGFTRSLVDQVATLNDNIHNDTKTHSCCVWESTAEATTQTDLPYCGSLQDAPQRSLA